jgi:hypothetical protein
MIDDGQASPMERRHNIDHVSPQSQIAEISPREKANHHRCSRAESKILSHFAIDYNCRVRSSKIRATEENCVITLDVLRDDLALDTSVEIYDI